MQFKGSASLLTVVLFPLLFACEPKEEEMPVKECSNPNFGETVSAMGKITNGVGYFELTKFWGSYEGELTYEWEHGATGPWIEINEPGIYRVTISDEGGCSVTKEYALGVDSSGEEDDGLKVGDTGPGGGIVFYVDENGGGLEAAPVSSIRNEIQWGCEGQEISIRDETTDEEITTSQEVGSGQNNTDLILSICGESRIAAALCNDLELNGFNDWYLPSVNELDKLSWVIFNEELTGFPAGNYWTSSEVISTRAYAVFLPDGGAEMIHKSTTAKVIAIRSFSSNE